MANLSDQFTEVITLIHQSQSRAVQQINRELIDLYWRVGDYISQKVASSEWGQGVVKQLAAFIRQQQPNIRGFSDKNLWRMKQFYETYADAPEKLSTVLRQISWIDHLIILSQSKTPEEREFYLLLTVRGYEIPDSI
jgi:hypothetical protein